MSAQTYQQLTKETLEEHRQIHFFLDQIVAAVRALETDEVEPMRRLAAQIDSFRERLVEHQQSEEQGGMYPAILELLPEARRELLGLRQQHQKMIEILEMARIHAQHGTPDEAPDLRTDLEHFLEMMRTHERDEEALLERALEQERRSHT